MREEKALSLEKIITLPLMKKYIIVIAAIAVALSSCNKKGKFEIDGSIANAPDSTLYLEAATNGVWYLVDSLKTNSDGEFDLKMDSPDFPEIYRLSMGNQAIYIPIDSIEKITLKSNAKNFGTDYTLSGTPNAVMLTEVDKQVRELYGTKTTTQEAKDKFKHDLGNRILKDPASIVAYYIINKQIDGKLLYDPSVKKDLAMICAVATAYKSFKPNDPRSELLERIAIAGQRKYKMYGGSKRDTVYATTSGILEISLPDKSGKIQKLSSVSSRGNVTILNFTAYTIENSPAINQKLAQIYNKFNGKGIEIYQIGLDPDLAQWKMAAKNLPWITVYDEAGTNSRNLANYNVSAIPTTYIIDRKGMLQERVSDMTKLESIVSKYL